MCVCVCERERKREREQLRCKSAKSKRHFSGQSPHGIMGKRNPVKPFTESILGPLEPPGTSSDLLIPQGGEPQKGQPTFSLKNPDPRRPSLFQAYCLYVLRMFQSVGSTDGYSGCTNLISSLLRIQNHQRFSLSSLLQVKIQLYKFRLLLGNLLN